MIEVSLVVVVGKPKDMKIPIKGSRFVIGRDKECHLRPNNPLVSKKHCMFEVSDNSVTLTDLKSTNGTLVNDQKLEGKVKLNAGDRVSIGALVFAVEITVTEPALAAAAADDDDDMAKWLAEDDGTTGGDDNLSEPGQDSTVMDLRLEQPTEPTPIEEPSKSNKPWRPSPPQGGDNKNDTATAASDLLSRYLVRRRDK